MSEPKVGASPRLEQVQIAALFVERRQSEGLGGRATFCAMIDDLLDGGLGGGEFASVHIRLASTKDGGDWVSGAERRSNHPSWTHLSVEFVLIEIIAIDRVEPLVLVFFIDGHC